MFGCMAVCTDVWMYIWTDNGWMVGYYICMDGWMDSLIQC